MKPSIPHDPAKAVIASKAKQSRSDGAHPVEIATSPAAPRNDSFWPVVSFEIRATHERKGIMPDEMTFELASVQFGAEPVAVFRFGYERFELRARLGPGNLEHAIAAAAEVAASVFARWSHEALAFAQRVRAGEDGGPVHH